MLAWRKTSVVRPEAFLFGTSKPAQAGSEPRSSAPCRGRRLRPGKASSAASDGVVPRSNDQREETMFRSDLTQQNIKGINNGSNSGWSARGGDLVTRAV